MLHQSKAFSALSSEFKNQGRPITSRPVSRNSRSLMVLILKSGVRDQSKALSSEFNVSMSSDLEIRGTPSVQGPFRGSGSITALN